MTSDLVVGMEIVGENSIERMKALAGNNNPMMGGKEQGTIRGMFG